MKVQSDMSKVSNLLCLSRSGSGMGSPFTAKLRRYFVKGDEIKIESPDYVIFLQYETSIYAT